MWSEWKWVSSTAPMRSPRTRQSARWFQEPGPVSTTQMRPPAKTAVQGRARVGCGSGEARAAEQHAERAVVEAAARASRR